jgi:hypothetical protein
VLGRLFSQRLIDHTNAQPENARNSVDPAVKRASATATEGPVLTGPGFKFGDPVFTGRKPEPDSLNRRTGRKGTAMIATALAAMAQCYGPNRAVVFKLDITTKTLAGIHNTPGSAKAH